MLISLVLVLPGCTGMPNLFGGTNVAANVPIAKEVEQSVIKVDAPKDTSTKQADRDIITTEKLETTKVEEAQEVTIINEAENWWVWMFALLGWLLPSPSEIGRSVSHFLLRLAGREPKQ